ncbi:MAG: quinol:electron acceptor oxidoreductase subunit ActD [Fuerstiella sp.]
MSTITPTQPVAPAESEIEVGGLLAEFRSAADVVSAAKLLRRQGYQNLEVYSPHPIHGIDKVLNAKGSLLPWGALAGAIIGLTGGLWMAWWMNAVDYPFIISGKPMFSFLPSLPVAFELAILLAAFAVFGGAIALGGLPRPANRLFRIPAFARATNDRFFICVDEADAKFQTEKTKTLLQDARSVRIESVPVIDSRESKLPRPFVLVAIVLSVLALIPPVLIAKARSTTSTLPRLSFISDMDHQPKFKAQTTNSLFADGRSMRPQMAGTIAQGYLRDDSAFYRGIQEQEAAGSVSGDSEGNVTFLTGTLTANGVASIKDEQPKNVPKWVTEFPVPVDESLIRRGQQRYEIFCATCHGIGGDGDGLVTLRALELEQGTWVKPTSLHAEPIREQPVGQLYNTIANGVRKMPGYASQIPVRDRWAIISYLRALQKTRTATADEVPADVLPNMRELN